MFAKETYIARRSRLAVTAPEGLLLLLGNDETGRNFEDNVYPFRQDSTFLYYFGLPYAGLNAVIDTATGHTTLFGDELTIDAIVWMGTQPTLHEKAERVGVTDVRPSKELAEVLKAAQAKGRDIHYLPVYRAEHSLKLWKLLGIRPGDEKPSKGFIHAVAEMRNHKSAEEIEEIDRACCVTADMHIEGIRCVRPGMLESEVMARIEEVAVAKGYTLSFSTIATINGQTLHNPCHSNLIEPGDLLLLDAGAESPMGYAGDMSSTIPANPTFTARQKEIYDIQVASHLAAVEMLRPGVRFERVYERASEVICEGLKALGIMKGSPEEAVKAGAHAMFFPCGLGHMMGLDDHDMENLGEEEVGWAGQAKSKQFGRKSLRLGRELEEGFALTIEPGVYFIPELIDLWKAEGRYREFINYDELEHWRHFGGVRNEEDYLITADGHRLLGNRIPLTTEEVEAMRVD